MPMIANSNTSGLLSDVRSHDARGKFAPGNKLGRGNPHARKVNQLRSAMLGAVTKADMVEVTQTVLRLAKGGDLDAAELLYDRVFGKPIQRDEELQSLIDETTARLGATR